MTLPAPSLASMLICAAAASAQWFTSWPLRLRRAAAPAPTSFILKSCTAKSVGAQAACAASGANRNRAEAIRVFMGGIRRWGQVGKRNDMTNIGGIAGFFRVGAGLGSASRHQVGVLDEPQAGEQLRIDRITFGGPREQPMAGLPA